MTSYKSNIIINTKELISNLLKNILDTKLTKLEDNNSNEVFSLTILNQNSKELINILKELSPNQNTEKENENLTIDLCLDSNININEEQEKSNYSTSTTFYKPKVLMKKNLKLTLNNSHLRRKSMKNRELLNSSENSINQMLNNKTMKQDTDNNKSKNNTINEQYITPFINTSRVAVKKKFLINKIIPNQKSPINLYNTKNNIKTEEKLPQKNLLSSHSYLDMNKIKKFKKLPDKKLNASQLTIKNNINNKKSTNKINKKRESTPTLTEKRRHVKNEKSNLTTHIKNNNKKTNCLNNDNISLANSEISYKIENEKITNDKQYKTIENFYPNNLHKKDINKELESICKNIEKDQRIIDLSFDELDDNKDNNKNDNNKNVNYHYEDKGFNLLNDSLLNDVYQDELLVKNNGRKSLFSEIDDENFKNKKICFYEKLENCIEYFKDFLTIRDLFELSKINKKFFHLIINLLIKNTENCIEEINKIFKQIPISYHIMNIKPFEFNATSTRAISLLNSISKNNLFKSDDVNFFNKNVLLIFDLFFIAIGKKNDIFKLGDNPKIKWEFICNFFKNNKTSQVGDLIEKEIKGRIFDEEIICALYEHSYKFVDIIKPNHYKKINKDIAILVFIIKNILEHVGISNEISIDNNSNKTSLNKLFILHNSRLIIKKKILNKLNNLLNN